MIALIAACCVWTQPTTTDKVMLGAAEALILADCSMTLNALRRPGYYEGNPAVRAFIGDDRGGARTLGVCLGGAALTAVLWYVLPDPWRKEFTIAVGAVELWNTSDMYFAGGIRFSLP